MKKVTSILMAFVLMLTLIPTAWAEGKSAGTMPELKDDVYKLENDVDLTSKTLTIDAKDNVTLDLNGHSIKVSNTESGGIDVYGKLTLMDSTDTAKDGTGNGKIWSDTQYTGLPTGFCAIRVCGNGHFIMESGLIDTATAISNNTANGQFAVGFNNASSDTAATVTINGGHIKAGWYAVSGNGSLNMGTAKVVVNGGVLESVADYALYLPQNGGKAEINGGVIYGAAGGIAINRGELTVNNGTITSKGTGSTGTWGDGTGNLEAAAINVNAAYGDAAVMINGGKMIAETNALFITNGTKHNGTITVTGGTFSSDPTAYLAAGYTASENNGTFTVVPKDYVAQIGDTKYVTLADAVAVGGDIKLLKDVAMDSTLALNKDMTLDLNGHKITNGSSLKTADYLIKITKEANVSIVGNKEGSAIADARNNKTGTITAISIYGKLVVDGDALTISRGTNGIALKVDEDSGKQGILVVKSGTITSTQAIQNWGSTTIDGGVLNGDVDSFAYPDLGGDMTINAGTFNGSVYSAQLKFGGKWPTVSAKTTITGGNFKGIIAEYYNDGTNGVQPVERVEKPADAAESVLIVTGGTFNTNPKDYVPAAGYTVAKAASGLYTVSTKTVKEDGTGENTSAVKLEVPATSGGTVIDTTVNKNDIETNKELTVTNGKTAVTINQAGVNKIGAIDLKLDIKADSKTPESANTAAYNKAMAGKDANSAVVVNISLTSGASNVFTTNVANAYALVTVPYSTDKADKLTVYYLNGSDATALTKVADAADSSAALNTFSYDAANKLITLKLPHFSEYLISTTATRSVVHHYGGSSTTTTTGTKTNSPTTFDAGVGIYAVSAILSVTGMAWVGTKQRKH